ncbi:HNH endonuclease [Acaryochloris marina]|uniref:HNH endonuclease n=1 Tax=Acaryochloris marina (strain MBIC 11017) TaxID=329726 RepID=A8ZK69_ACAM1|nr:HNH endonuclease signature motif containing protein [Acaryochloris marina]ABW31568.1 conserved hypothetical protein [Acaryochloris marina MBIC11017]
MQSEKPNLSKFSTLDTDRVLELEAKRKAKGYQPGWLYYQCKPLGLVDVMESLRSQGLIEAKNTKEGKAKPRQLLTIELVPRSCWFSNVRSEVSKEDWNELRKMTYEKANNRCEVCGGRGPKHPVECHEIWHYDDDQHIQKLEGLIALCPSCHEVKHRGLANVKGRGEIADQHLAKVNHWTMPKTQKYVDDQFQVWIKRSKYEWELDISWLNQFGIQVKPKRVRSKVVNEGMDKNSVRVLDNSHKDWSLDDFMNPNLF